MAEEVDLSTLQKRLEAIAAVEEAENKVRAIRKEIAGLTDQHLVQLEAISEKSSTIATAIEREQAARENIGVMHEVQLQRLERRLELKTDENEREQISEDILRAKIDHIEKVHELTGEISEQQKKDLETSKEELKVLKEKVKLKKEEKGIQKGLTKSFGKMFNLKAAKGPFSADGIGKTVGDFKKLSKSAGGFGKAMVKMGPQLGAAMLKKFAENIVNLAIALHDAEANFRRTTGASEKFSRGMTKSYEATRLYGVSIADASKATAALFKQFTDFSQMTEYQRVALQNTTAVLGNMGITASASAKIVQAASKGMGVALGQEELVLREIATTAMDLELDLAKHASDVAGISDKLYQYGTQSRQIMKDLAIAYKATGIEMSRIITIAAKFDTFEGAAESAGKLNAALGGNFVNAMELMRTTNPVKRMLLIKDAIDKTGLSFDEMDYYQRKMFMNAANMKDEAELAKLMSGNYEELAGSVQKNAKHYKDLRDATAANQSMQKAFQSLLGELTPIITPIIEGITGMIKWMTKSKKAIKVLQGLLAGLAIAFVALAGAPVAVAVAIGALVSAITMLVNGTFKDDVGASTFFEGIGKLNHMFTDMGDIVGNIVGPIMALGDAFGWVGSKIKGAWESGKKWTSGLFGGGLDEKELEALEARFKESAPRTSMSVRQQGASAGLSEARFLEGAPPVAAATTSARALTAAAGTQMTTAPAAAIRANREAARMQVEQYQIAAAKQQPARYEPKIDVYIGQEKLEKIAGEAATVRLGSMARDGLYGTG